ncbi:MIP/aquaporin family protein [Calothrix sp. 336/3]|uniref:MIP/aquaporin family protein n=1 Tax=Calothrix sp. 336/3 TaxID=1337936 RepID=UPI0004E2A5D9|nr:aquaporin [Calothrix sp. 336/3]AKG20101.1 major intrinsic protein [Calothrix sp. 336/3]
MNTLHRHYPEYLMEAAGLGIFMISAAVVTALLEHPASPIQQAISEPFLRRFIIGVAMGLTAIAIIYSPWGKQSGAHINPVVTFTFFRLGKIKPTDTVFYILAQFVGGFLGLVFATKLLEPASVKFPKGLADPSINYIVTIPGTGGVGIAFIAELSISFGMMLMILFVSNIPKLSRWTGICAAVLITTYITLEAPLSGMSMNPARTLASAILAQNWTAIWVYFTAPLLGMLLAAEVYVQSKGKRAVYCAKLNHHNHKRCIFRCGYRQNSSNGQSILSDKLPSL